MVFYLYCSLNKGKKNDVTAKNVKQKIYLFPWNLCFKLIQ